jgi:anti-sigma factor RsiW
MNDRHPTEDELIAWALDDLAAADREEVAAHFAGCPQCRELAQGLQAALRSYRTSRRPEDAPTRILADLLAAQARHVRGGGRWSTLRRLAPALAAAALLGVVFLTGFWMGSRSEGPPIAPQRDEAGSALRSPLPDPPRVDFQATPPLEA